MSSRPSSTHSPSEQTPLLSRHDEERNFEGANGAASPPSQSIHSAKADGKEQRRWATIIALSILSLAALAILGLGFAAPAAVEEYAKEALVIEPNNLSIDSFTAKGVRARIQATCFLDASRVRRKPIRDIGRASTWIVKEIESGNSEVNVYLPEYGNLLLGTAKLPPVNVNVRNRHYNHFDFFTDLEPGDMDGVRNIVNDFLDGRLNSLSVKAVVSVPLKSGLINLGTKTLSQELHFQGHDLPKLPDLAIDELKFDEYGPPGKPDGMKTMAKVSVMNDYPVKFDVPSLHFDILLRDCSDRFLTLADARTEIAHILPKQFVNVSVAGLIRQLPTALTTACPESHVSPLDSILGDYLQGKKTTVYVRGAEQDVRTPDWITEFLRGTTIPLPLPGHPFDNLIRSFSLANVQFSLPDPSAEPDTPESQPKISATVKALVALPKEMNFNLDVDQVKADVHVYHRGDKLGKLDLRKWQPARTTKVGSDLLIESDVTDAPLEISDGDVFTEVIQELLFGKGVTLDINADVDVNTVTALGEFVVRKIPAQGDIFIKPIGQGFVPTVSDLKIVDTTKSTITFSALVNLTNPTEYSAHVPYVNVSISHNDTAIGFASAQADMVPGMNSVVVTAMWETNTVGRELLSQILSGWNTTLTLKSHAGTIPSQPKLGDALSGLEIVVDTPKLFGKFIKDATMHVISSTATFVLISPVSMFITMIAATAFYNGTEVGTINWNYPFAIDEGESTTPKLPVEWKVDGLGAVRDALGGTLKLDAKADVGVRIGKWQQTVWYEGGGIGAKIRL